VKKQWRFKQPSQKKGSIAKRRRDKKEIGKGMNTRRRKVKKEGHHGRAK